MGQPWWCILRLSLGDTYGSLIRFPLFAGFIHYVLQVTDSSSTERSLELLVGLHFCGFVILADAQTRSQCWFLFLRKAIADLLELVPCNTSNIETLITDGNR